MRRIDDAHAAAALALSKAERLLNEIARDVSNLPEPDEAYFLDNYGTCNRPESCACVRPENPWLGRKCLHWVPLGVRSFSELAAFHRTKNK